MILSCRDCLQFYSLVRHHSTWGIFSALSSLHFRCIFDEALSIDLESTTRTLRFIGRSVEMNRLGKVS